MDATSFEMDLSLANLTQTQYEIYCEDFAELDVDASGALDEDEIKTLLARQLGKEPSPQALKAYFADIDKVWCW